jgi:hypothetical protein
MHEARRFTFTLATSKRLSCERNMDAGVTTATMIGTIH